MYLFYPADDALYLWSRVTLKPGCRHFKTRVGKVGTIINGQDGGAIFFGGGRRTGYFNIKWDDLKVPQWINAEHLAPEKP